MCAAERSEKGMKFSMTGNTNLSQEDKREKIEQQMLEIYKSYQNKDEKSVISITYYNQLVISISQSQTMYGLKDAFTVSLNITGKDGKNRIAIYQEGKEIAMIDENSNITFSQEYLLSMKKISISIYLVLQKINGQHFDLPDLQENKEDLPQIVNDEKVNNFSLQKEELDTKEAESERNNLEEATQDVTIEEMKEQETETKDEEANMRKIAQKSGKTIDDIKSCSTIDPKEKITDEESFENIINATGRYTKIFVVASNEKVQGNSRFAFWGITADGQVEQIPGLEERDGVNTGKSIYSINRDGSEVKEQQTAALFTLPNQREGFSVTIGQYGIVETTYIRRSPTENKFIGSSINSSTQKPTTTEVQEFMNERRTTDDELQETIDRTEHQLNETEKTKLNNIDDDLNNDRAIDLDAKITLHDGTITTLRDEAERLNISPEEYKKEFEQAKGDCFSDKIELIRDTYEDRGERTLESDALDRINRHE